MEERRVRHDKQRLPGGVLPFPVKWPVRDILCVGVGSANFARLRRPARERQTRASRKIRTAGLGRCCLRAGTIYGLLLNRPVLTADEFKAGDKNMIERDLLQKNRQPRSRGYRRVRGDGPRVLEFRREERSER